MIEKIIQIDKESSQTLEELAAQNGWNSIFETGTDTYVLAAPSPDGFICRKLIKNEFVTLPKNTIISKVF